ncbi:MAG TPA: N-methyl-L-tryptophan oxidase [Candidatus Dormibacteraeota bacterium]|jgi:sarcosine oxidase|nr:N-methyl-L-tryptophan oxidase [Candidatus Dormibacteraeota bacterium]
MRVAVIGGGVMGAATAWRLTGRGAHVACFDRHSPPHVLGSSHGDSRMIRTAYFEGPWYVPLLQEAFPLWRELEAATGAKLLTETGALMLGAPSSELVMGVLESARQHHLPVERLSAQEVRHRYPAHVVDDGVVGVVDRQGGFLRAEPAVSAMLSQVPEVAPETTISTVGDLLPRFDAVVVAAGSWTPELVDWIPLRIERQTMTWFGIEPDADSLQPDRFPAFIRQMPEGDYVYGFPTLDGSSIKVARHHEGEPDNPEPIRRFVSECLGGVAPDIVRTVPCLYTNTPDGHFVIDFAPLDGRVVVISACSGHGFKFAPVVGDIAADLVLEGRTRRDISRFGAARFATSHVPSDHDRGDDQG